MALGRGAKTEDVLSTLMRLDHSTTIECVVSDGALAFDALANVLEAAVARDLFHVSKRTVEGFDHARRYAHRQLPDAERHALSKHKHLLTQPYGSLDLESRVLVRRLLAPIAAAKQRPPSATQKARILRRELRLVWGLLQRGLRLGRPAPVDEVERHLIRLMLQLERVRPRVRAPMLAVIATKIDTFVSEADEILTAHRVRVSNGYAEAMNRPVKRRKSDAPKTRRRHFGIGDAGALWRLRRG